MKSCRTRTDFGCKRELGTADRSFQARIPFTTILFWGFSQESGYHASSPSSIRFHGLSYFLTERTNHKEKPFFGILAWKHSRLVIRIFRINSESKSPACNSHPGLGWVKAKGAWGGEHRTISTSSPPLPKLHRHPSLILPSWINAPF